MWTARFRSFLNSQPVWFDRLWLTMLYAAFTAVGFWAGTLWCQAQQADHLVAVTRIAEQVSRVGEECVQALNGFSRAAVIVMRSDRRVRIVPVRDTLRAH